MENLKTITINGREKHLYELTNEELITLVNDENLSSDAQNAIKDKIIARFKDRCCKRQNETSENVFVRQFSDFVNTTSYDIDKVGKLMNKEHRYLQQEMFKVFLSYVQELSMNYNCGYYDGRNEYSCKCADIIIDCLQEKKLI